MKKLLRIAGVIAFISLATFLWLISYSTSPSFCKSCHIMKPYYEAWKTSSHKGVACVDCHYPPGSPRTLLWKKFQALSQVAKYVTRTYSSKPFAEVEDASCLRSGCHSTRLLDGKIVTTKGIKFDHRPHLLETKRGRNLRCSSCHSQIVVGKHIEVTYDTCYLCHFKGMTKGRELKTIGGCLGCHDLPSKSFQIANITYNHKDFVTKRGISCQNCHLDIIQGKGEASQDRCLTCHNQPEKLSRYNEVSFIHTNHVTKHNVACFHCHQEIQHGFTTPGSTSLAAKDHRTTLAFDCSFCHVNKHKGQLNIYSGNAKELGLPVMPSPMYLANVDCVGCHYSEKQDIKESEFIGYTYTASMDACTKCHGSKFKGIWEETKNELNETLIQSGKKLELAQTALNESKTSTAERKKLEAQIKEAEKLYHFVHASHGEHNVYLASYALRKVDQLVSETGEKLKTDMPDLSNLPLISGSFCATMCHSKVGVNVPPETVKVSGKTMPHKMHTEMMGCVKCHEIGTHKATPLKKDFQSVCAGCHT